MVMTHAFPRKKRRRSEVFNPASAQESTGKAAESVPALDAVAARFAVERSGMWHGAITFRRYQFCRMSGERPLSSELALPAVRPSTESIALDRRSSNGSPIKTQLVAAGAPGEH